MSDMPTPESQENEPKIITLEALVEESEKFRNYKKSYDSSIVQESNKPYDKNKTFKMWLKEAGYDIVGGLEIDIPTEQLPVIFKNNNQFNDQNVIVLTSMQAMAVLIFFGFSPFNNDTDRIGRFFSGADSSYKGIKLDVIVENSEGNPIPEVKICFMSSNFNTPINQIGYNQKFKDAASDKIEKIKIFSISASFSGLEI